MKLFPFMTTTQAAANAMMARCGPRCGTLVLAALLCVACPGQSKKAALPAPSPSATAAATSSEALPPAPQVSPSATGSALVESVGTDNPTPASSAPTELTGEPPRELPPPQRTGSGDSTRVAGQVVAARQGDLSFKVGGHILGVIVKVGERVTKGQKLATLDTVDYDLRARIAAGAVEAARIAFEQAKRDLQREEELQKEGATTAVNLERASNTMASARIALGNAELQSRQARKALDDATLTAPYDGVISKKLKSEGEYVGVGAPVFRLSGDTDVEVSLRLPENLMGSVAPGQKLPLYIPSSGANAELEITRIVPVVDEVARTFEIIGIVSTKDTRIAPGQFVEAAIRAKGTK